MTKSKSQTSCSAEISQKAAIPVLPLSDIVVFPGIVAPLLVSESASIKLVDDVVAGSRILVMVLQKDPKLENPKPDELHAFGCTGKVLKMLKFPDDTVRVLVQGLKRVQILKYFETTDYLNAYVEPIEEITDDSIETKALANNATKLFQETISLSPALPDELKIAAVNQEDASKLSDLIASNLNISLGEKEDLLETSSVKQRLIKLTRFLNRELHILKLGTEIQSKVSSQIIKNQRTFLLREQLKAIRSELGDKDDQAAEIEELRERIEKCPLNEEARKVANREVERLAITAPASAEHTIIRTYLDWILNLPWNSTTEDRLDIKQARRILDEDHYGLGKVKDRILEYLAVLKLKNSMKGPILCFAGPPGVGKTSLGMSIARAMGRKFVRISLGGMRDEAEIRGHRRTYVGAMPGRLIQAFRRCESANPVFMLDEIDKVGADFRGDPSSALLEVLDPQQNSTFTDHYLEVSFDLSKVMFITTANWLDPISPALRDRLEIINISGYTEEEKTVIAKKFLLPRQMKEHGLRKSQVKIDNSAVSLLIRNYTREAGVRNLEREIATICRKVARQVIENRKKKILVNEKLVFKFLGPERFEFELANRNSEPGTATGMAWTPVGGDILFIEVSKMPGRGNLALTGSLGEVMRESAQAALTYIRSHALHLQIDPKLFSKLDIHIHVPAGATPKDGPSAGVTIAVAIASMLSQKAVRHDLAMTGEITLRGKVLPVGGIKEKVLAAARAGITSVILPDRNRKDLIDIPPEIKRKLTFHFVKDLDGVLSIALKKA